MQFDEFPRTANNTRFWHKKNVRTIIPSQNLIRTGVARSRHKNMVVFAQILGQNILETGVALVPIKGFRVPNRKLVKT